MTQKEFAEELHKMEHWSNDFEKRVNEAYGKADRKESILPVVFFVVFFAALAVLVFSSRFWLEGG